MTRGNRHQHLRDLNELFRYRGDAQIIVSLAAHPCLGYADLARAIVAHTGDRLSDGEINRCLPRLQDNGVVAGDGPRRQKSYRLTGCGRDKADLITFILDALEQRDDDVAAEPDQERAAQSDQE